MRPLLTLMERLCSYMDEISPLTPELSEEFANAFQKQLQNAQLLIVNEMQKQLGNSKPIQFTTPVSPVIPETSPTKEEISEVFVDTEEQMLEESLEQELEPVDDSFIEDDTIPTESSIAWNESSLEENTAVASMEDTVLPEVKEVTPEETPIPMDIVKEKEPIVIQVSNRKWVIPSNTVMYQQQDITITRGEHSEDVKFTISPLSVLNNGIVPILVNAEYRSEYGSMYCTTVMSSEEAPLLQANINSKYHFLIKGQFENGNFSAVLMTTDESIEQGDIITVKNVGPVIGTEAVPKIILNEDATLWISFTEANFFGMLHLKSGDWLDEYNASHDAMLIADEDYQELHTSLTEEGWSLEY